ncbi:MAG TPA: nucleotidyltransferase [Chloroflexi bacterium]|nr:nucleotidyltransferase [Chloroflexota bacterium]
MKLIIPLAGFGSRLRPHTYSRPKALLNTAGQPVLGHVLNMFKDLDIEEFIFIIGYMGDQIQSYITSTYPNIKAQFVEQKHLNGQSPAILLAKNFINGPVLIGFADTLVKTDLTQLQDANQDAITWVKEVKDPRRFGVAITDKTGNVTQIIEKPSTMEHKLAIVGFYFLRDGQSLMDAIETQVNNNIETKGEYYLADAIQILLKNGLKMTTYEVDVWLDCGKPDSLLLTNKYLLNNGHDTSHMFRSNEYTIVPPVNIHPSATITNSVVGPYATIGANCKINSSIIKNTIIEENSTIENSLISQSLIGQHTIVKNQAKSLIIGDQSIVTS